MIIRIKNLKARTIVGVYDSERTTPQQVVMNIKIEYDASAASKSDKRGDILDYCELSKRIIEKVEQTHFHLLERLVDFVVDLVMQEPRALRTEVEIDKTEVLKPYADSVSVTGTAERK